jgi:hypothetical protein
MNPAVNRGGDAAQKRTIVRPYSEPQKVRAATALSTARRRTMRAVSHSEGASTGNADPKRALRRMIRTTRQDARRARNSARTGWCAGPCRSSIPPRRRHKACRTRFAVWERQARTAGQVRWKRPTDNSGGHAIRKLNAQSLARADAAHARRGQFPEALGPRAFRVNESRGPAHARAKPSARHTRSKIACDRLFFAFCLPPASPE